MAERPFFSIVIPTLNRADLLRDALRSALQQTFDDYEIVVSDNCSTDHTHAVIRELANARVRVVRPDHVLPMPSHWEFALPHARGEYVTYLCDDDALTPNALEETARAIEGTRSSLLCAPYFGYYLPTWYEEEVRNCLIMTRLSGGLSEHDSADTLRGIFSCRIAYWSPRMLNSFAHRELLEAAIRKVGPLFRLSPDLSFAVAIQTVAASWIMIERPLRVFGIAKEGIGASGAFRRDNGVVAEFVGAFGEAKLLTRVPLALTLVTSHITEAILVMKEAARLGIEIDRAQFFVEARNDIAVLEANGVDVRRDWALFDEAVGKESSAIQRDVRARIARAWHRKYKARVLPRKSWLRRRLWQFGLANHVLLDGDRWGFHDIVECAQWLGRRVPLGWR